MIERRHYYISGRVQGVGFRYRATYAARAYGLTGYVRNLDDGRVEMEVQGERELITRWFTEIEGGMFISFDDIEMTKMKLNEDERNFKVVV